MSVNSGNIRAYIGCYKPETHLHISKQQMQYIIWCPIIDIRPNEKQIISIIFLSKKLSTF